MQQPAERTNFQPAAPSLARVERSFRIFRIVGIAWAVSALGMEVVSFPQFCFEWHRGAPLALSTGGLAFFWAFCALWGGGFRIGRRRITPQIVLREEMPGKFWRAILIALSVGTALLGVGFLRLRS